MRLVTRAGTRDALGTGLSSARARFERRAARARRRPLLLGGGVALVVAIVSGLVWLGWFSSLLLAQRVEVRGVSASQAKVVREVAALPLGTPLMRVDTDAAETRLERDRRWVDISVSRSLPHSLVIELTPRVAVVALRLPSGQVELYDKLGVPFRLVDKAPASVPLVSSSGGASADGVRAVLQALDALDPELRADVADVALSSIDRVSFRLESQAGPRTVVWGGPGDAATKARLVAVLLTQPGQTIDVSVPEAPVTR